MKWQYLVTGTREVDLKLYAYTIKFAITRKRSWPARLVTRFLGRNDGEAQGRSEDSKRRVKLYIIEGETARSYHFVLYLVWPIVMFAVNDVTLYDVMCIPRGQAADGTLFTRPFLPLWVGGAGARD